MKTPIRACGSKNEEHRGLEVGGGAVLVHERPPALLGQLPPIAIRDPGGSRLQEGHPLRREDGAIAVLPAMHLGDQVVGHILGAGDAVAGRELAA
jgi:hypothetical protein